MQSCPNYQDVGLTLTVESRPFIIHSDRSFLLSADKDELHLPVGEAPHSCQSSSASPPGTGSRHAVKFRARAKHVAVSCHLYERYVWMCIHHIDFYGEMCASSSVTEVQFQRN